LLGVFCWVVIPVSAWVAAIRFFGARGVLPWLLIVAVAAITVVAAGIVISGGRRGPDQG